MNMRGWGAAICLIAGIPLAAYGLAGGGTLLAVLGLALVLVFWFLAWQWITSAGKPKTPIKPAANAAWNMREQGLGETGSAPFAPTPSPSPASGGGEKDGGASRRGEDRGDK